MDTQKEKIRSYIIRLAAEFILAEASKASLITVTDCRIADNMRDMTILLSVLPESEEEHALNFLKRKRSEFRNYVKKHSRLKYIPYFDFEIDFGEKNRQAIEEIAQKG